MGRRGSLINAVIRDMAQAQRRAAAEQRRQLAAAIRAQKETQRVAMRAAREEKQRYVEERSEEANGKTIECQEKIRELGEILAHTLSVNDSIDFSSLKTKETFPSFIPAKEMVEPRTAPVKDEYLAKVKPLGFLKKAIPGSKRRYQAALEKAEEEYQAAMASYERIEELRIDALNRARKEYEEARAAFELKKRETDLEVDKFEVNYRAGNHDAMIDYCTMVLERSEYPEDFPQEFRIALVPESKQLVVDYELPNPEIIPEVVEFRYIRSKDLIEEKPRKPAEIKELYQDIVSSIALRTCHELFEGDQIRHLDVVVFNGFVQTVDASTGKDISPYLISVRMTREQFENIDLSRVDKRACLRNLGATVSPRPYEVQPVKPIIEFDMVDKRFVEQSDVLADLESRPNLMDLNPFEFENLVANLFGKMGLDTKQTRSSKDGGVDAVAFDLRPVIGGKVVIQAKRYKNTVGVSAVRDLYGTMMNEGANKGILVTTSGYGPDAFEFAKDKPIELLDGGQLLYLLEQIGTKARIIFPEDWKGN